MFRLGDDLVVRLPRRAMSAALVEHEHRWLPVLAPGLPLGVPAPVRLGRPALGYPWSWTVCPWLPGTSALARRPRGLDGRRRGHRAASWPPSTRRLPPTRRRTPTGAARSPTAIPPSASGSSAWGARLDGPAVLAVWEGARAQPGWDRPPVWVHGDLHPANLLVADGRLSGVIDFGDITVGDPAYDLAVAWMWLPAAVRPAFRAVAGVGADDAATWARARGWALALGVTLVADAGRRAGHGGAGSAHRGGRPGRPRSGPVRRVPPEMSGGSTADAGGPTWRSSCTWCGAPRATAPRTS